MKKLIIDFDAFKYAAASIAEKRMIFVTHKKTNRVRTFDNRTEFKKFLESKNIVYNPEKWEIKDHAAPLDFSIATKYIENSLTKIKNNLGVSNIHGFIGKGDSFRLSLSTMLKYKGNRDGLVKPLYLNAVVDHIIEKYDCDVVEGIETDDRLVIEATQDKDLVIVGEDKDYRGCQVNFYDFNKEKMHVPSNFGSLQLEKDSAGANKVVGNGSLFLYFQVLAGDATDNYKANALSDVKWGPMAAYKALYSCKNLKEAFFAVEESYKKLYPTVKVFKSWNNCDYLLDWKYAMTENISMAYLLREEKEIKGITKDEYIEKFKAGG